jgi:hypothetical protein
MGYTPIARFRPDAEGIEMTKSLASGRSRSLRIIPCSVCGLDKWRETNPVKVPGHYSRIHSRSSCKCR